MRTTVIGKHSGVSSPRRRWGESVKVSGSTEKPVHFPQSCLGYVCEGLLSLLQGVFSLFISLLPGCGQCHQKISRGHHGLAPHLHPPPPPAQVLPVVSRADE